MQTSMWDEPLPMQRWAEFEPPYRWLLGRRWNAALPTLAWLMLNPSTADGAEDDPTMRKVVGFSTRAGYGACLVTNAYPFQATDPADLKCALKADPDRVTGPRGAEPLLLLRSDEKTLEAAQRSTALVLAWGGHCPVGRARELLRMLNAVVATRPLLCLGYTKNGHPRHPLMVPYAQPLVPFERQGVLG